MDSEEVEKGLEGSGRAEKKLVAFYGGGVVWEVNDEI